MRVRRNTNFYFSKVTFIIFGFLNNFHANYLNSFTNITYYFCPYMQDPNEKNYDPFYNIFFNLQNVLVNFSQKHL